MKINVEFDNLDEIKSFCTGILATPEHIGQERPACGPRGAETSKEATKDTRTKKSTPKNEALNEELQTSSNTPSASKETLTKDNPTSNEENAATTVKNQHTDTELKMLLSGKLKEGKKKEVKALFEKYGVSCLTDLIEKQRDSIDTVFAEAEVL